MLFSYSGKTIPNGTDKNQLGTPENEGKFQKCPLYTVKNLDACRRKTGYLMFSYLVVGLPLLCILYNNTTIFKFIYTATHLTTNLI